MSYFAAALVADRSGWTATELDLGRPSELSDVEDVANLLRDVDTEAVVSVLFIEVDDEYLAILRLDEGEDLRVFGSDAAFVDDSPLGAVLLDDEERPGLELPDDDDDEVESEPEEYPTGPPPDAVEPIGDRELLADLGVPGKRLVDLCAADGMMPSDVTTEICAVLGCVDQIEELR